MLVPTPTIIATVFPNSNPAVLTTIFRVVVPPNITRGAVTLERVRGSLWVWNDQGVLEAGEADWNVNLSLQLVPVRNAAVVAESVLDVTNSADQESNRIIWQRQYYPPNVNLAAVAVEIAYFTMPEPTVDIKSRRRFDRSMWALAVVCETNTGNQTRVLVAGHLRALFRATDAV